MGEQTIKAGDLWEIYVDIINYLIGFIRQLTGEHHRFPAGHWL